MATRGWLINLTGSEITVYNTIGTTQIGKLTKNECFAEGTGGTGWEGWGAPVYFKNASGVMTHGCINTTSQLAEFANYASNGTSWVSVNVLKRKVQYDTIAYYADGSKYKNLPAGSYVWLTQKCTRGESNPNYVAVTKVQPKDGSEFTFTGNGFVDLTYGSRWLNVGSILLRQA